MCNAHFICEMVNGPATVPITEAQVVAFLIERAKTVQTLFGKDQYAKVSLNVLVYGIDCGNAAPEITFTIGSQGLYKNYNGSTFDDAVNNAGEQSPENVAQQKRAEAARLIAEADALAPAAK
jgi:hypothetical protein